MTDKELLESAAKAAGLRVWDWLPGPHGFATETAPGHSRRWNPLTDDGDALRLAVKLQIGLDADSERVAAYSAYDYPVYKHQATEKIMADACAATRRAIVRAAAAMADR